MPRVRRMRTLRKQKNAYSSHTKHRNSFFLLSSCSIFTWESSFAQLQQSFEVVRNSLIETVSKCREMRRRMPTTPLVGTKRRIHLRRATPAATAQHFVVRVIFVGNSAHVTPTLLLREERVAAPPSCRSRRRITGLKYVVIEAITYTSPPARPPLSCLSS